MITTYDTWKTTDPTPRDLSERVRHGVTIEHFVDLDALGAHPPQRMPVDDTLFGEEFFSCEVDWCDADGVVELLRVEWTDGGGKEHVWDVPAAARAAFIASIERDEDYRRGIER